MRPETEKVRSISEKELYSLKRVTNAAIDLAGGPTVAAMTCRVSGSELSKYANFCHPLQDGKSDVKERYVPLDVAVEIDRTAQSPAILSVYASLLGFEIVPATSPDTIITSDEADDIDEMDALEFLCGAGKVADEIRSALKDDHIDAFERDRIEAELHKLKRCANRILRRLGC